MGNLPSPAANLPGGSAKFAEPQAPTPGPWGVRSHFVGPLMVCDANREAVALVVHDDFRTCAANARLIAAAPDMFKVCRSLLSTIDDLGIDACSDFPHLRSIASNAIRSATGAK